MSWIELNAFQLYCLFAIAVTLIVGTIGIQREIKALKEQRKNPWKQSCLFLLTVHNLGEAIVWLIVLALLVFFLFRNDFKDKNP